MRSLRLRFANVPVLSLLAWRWWVLLGSVVVDVALPGDPPWASTYSHGYETPIHAALAGLVRAQLRLQSRSQTWLAEACGLSQKHVSMMLTGLADGSFVTWSAMATALGIEWRIGVARAAHNASSSSAAAMHVEAGQ